MGKKDKSAGSTSISGSGTLSLDREQRAQALQRKEYSKSTGELVPIGVYNAEILEATIEVQGGIGVTAGSDKYTLKLVISEGAHQRRQLFARAIAHGSTAGQLYNMFEAVGIDVEALPEPIVLPTEREIQNWVGMTVRAFVKHKEYEGKTQLDVGLGALENGASNGGKKAKKDKIAK